MAVQSFLRRSFWIVPLPMIGVAAACNAMAVSHLVGAMLTPSADDLARPLPGAYHAQMPTPARRLDPTPLLKRNPFDHVAGSLMPKADEAAVEGTEAPVADNHDPLHAPTCEGVSVDAIVESDDEDWSFASLAGSDGKHHMLRREQDIGDRKVYFIGWDRVWLTHAGQLCQVDLMAEKKPPPPPPVASAPPAAVRGSRAQPLAADLKQGIQKVSATEWNIDRGVVDRILENQADLMRQARIVPVQENGRITGVRLNGVRPDALLGVLGMQNGDQLQTINGFEMASPEKALEAYARLRTADKLQIQLVRGGKTLGLDYNIK